MLLPMVCILRLAFILLTPITNFLNPYGYYSVYSMVIDFIQVLAMAFQVLLLKFMRFQHITAQFLLLILNFTWLIIIFWPMLFYKLYTDPNGRSIYEILSNPKNSDTRKSKQDSIIMKQKSKQASQKLRFYNQSRLIFTSPSSQGAYAHVDEPGIETISDLMKRDLYHKQIYHDDPLKLKVPYEYMVKQQIKPPDGM